MNTGKDTGKDDRDEFVNIDDVSGDLVKCFQIQVDDSGVAHPVYIGSYKDVPLVTHTTILYNQEKDRLNVSAKKIENIPSNQGKNHYRIHVVTYILPEDAVNSKLYKIVGLVIQKNEEPESHSSLDLRYNTDNSKFEYIFCEHAKDECNVVETLEAFPGKDNVLNGLVERIFVDPVKSVILS